MAANVVTGEVLPALVAPAPPRRPRLLLVGTGLAAAGCVVFFAGLIGIYLALRHAALADGGTWLPSGAEIPLTPGTMTLFTLGLSIVTMQWAVQAVGNNDRQHAILALGITTLFGGAAINSTTYLFSRMGMPVADSTAGLLVHVIAGAHIAMIVAALVYAAVMTFRTLGGDYAGRDREGVAAAALFWYATCAVYPVIWFAIYVTK